ncbi:hypothetical protein E3N88_05684 [Mikania micrantha]|uniref:Uncharacterized protein n=1 Tax=Mikania micrantha TaxID=192012 RepID=A0A5N6PLM9_9ASTR|nr:hypothetical protein E3N88_05684 [Mikania micrantha]
MMNVGENRAQNGVMDCPESRNEENFQSIELLDSSRLRENRARYLNQKWRPMGETLVSPSTSRVEPPPLLLRHTSLTILFLIWTYGRNPNQVVNRVIQMNNIEESEVEDGVMPDRFVCIKMRLIERRIYIPDFHPYSSS